MASHSFRLRATIAGLVLAGAAASLLTLSSAAEDGFLSHARLWMEGVAGTPDWQALPRGPLLQQATQRGELVVAVRAYPRPAPPGVPAPAEPDDYDAALARYVAGTLGVPVRIVNLPAPGQQTAGISGKLAPPSLPAADLIIGGTRYGIPLGGAVSAPSAEQVVSTPYITGRAELIALRAALPDKAAGHSVCLQQGSPYAASLAGEQGAQPLVYASSVHAAYAFMSGDCDILAEDNEVLKRLLAREDWRFYKPVPVKVRAGQGAQIILSRPDGESARYLDKVVRRWLASGAQQEARQARAGEVSFEVATLKDGLVCHS
ncbi:hypothetical protein CAL29_01580 [Bordetella genomosp. 10]|uniref:Solute-binding protein family 3/N-terminal domain-containing protein n=1 Tax=Bordetella genomosp. 10 TaxID=1416804 RepID=A0A261SI73_9BORD|nr:hypothetical protein [Bordetella genomosp. 10]OZI37148.1 hypothetical protein CAL29_01580 [Bordetella genomosp. 10]